jgi:tripartite ATP-independent transporter DctM subunit
MIVSIAALIMFTAFFINIPIFIAVLMGVLTYFFLEDTAIPVLAAQRFVGGGENITLLAIPFFMLLGNLLNYTGITTRMLRLAELMIGRVAGGLAQANVLLSTMLGGLSASNLADCAMLCKMLVPEMTKLGYGKAFSTAVTAAGALITPIIPPGIALIIYAFVADVSVGKMFMAGIVPGIMCCAALMITIHFISSKRGYRPARAQKPTPLEWWQALKGASAAFVLILAIIGGIRFGAFTPTEAGAMACAFVVFIGMFVYREMKLADIVTSLLETARATSTVLLIMMACSAFAWILSWEMVAQDFAALVTGVSDSPVLFLLMVNFVLLILGMLIEGNAIIIVLVPLLMPTVKALHIDPVHFGIVIILNLAIGCLTPPMGTVMFMGCSITGIKVSEFVKEALPLIAALLVVLLLITFIPSLAIFLPYL